MDSGPGYFDQLAEGRPLSFSSLFPAADSHLLRPWSSDRGTISQLAAHTNVLFDASRQPAAEWQSVDDDPPRRIALEGKYCAIPYRPSIVKPASTPAEIALLPQGPPADPIKQKRTRETEAGVVEAPVNCEEKRRYRRIVDRIDISVRFGVHAHFAPYQPELTVPSWGAFCVTRAVADKDSVLWAEVIWEIALMNFRLELLDVDRDLLPALYAQEDSSAAAACQHDLLGIWGIKGFLRPMWMETDRVDELSADDWEVRREAFVRWAHVMQGWPGIDLQWDASALRDRGESRATLINGQSSPSDTVGVSAPSSASCASPSQDCEATLSRLAPTPPIPLRPPHSAQPSVFLPQEIGWLDALLLSWGYYDDPKAFVLDFEQDFEQVRGNPATRATWVRGKVAWLAQGDLILDTIENFLADGGCTTWGDDKTARIWAGLTQVVFKMQWVMTAAEVRLGGMQ
ncbi:hypothetical protein A0H81_01938 [Grifola frondosa]|uniref:Uncharacterized protein n=1 Tax=Grifola frondosa TaxID=5627 RepID=A0A1C7MLM4_GRIFR|nr:hypothetical protein A0H81_01938 [Grifola frondosa]